VAFHREVEGARPDPGQPVEQKLGHHELRRTNATWQLATGSMACPDCDAPVLPHAGGASPADPIACPFCEHTAFVRDFLSLGEPTRPTHVVVRVVRRAVAG
jgi:hypothetical protein